MIKKDKKTDVSHLNSEEKTILIYMQLEKNNLLIDKYNRLDAKIKLLEAKLAKNSKNSSKPPSSDTKKPKKTTSSKLKTGKKPGGQPGHKGHHLQMSSKPDEVIKLTVDTCGHCCHNLKRVKGSLEKRQEFEIPKPKMWVTEYQAEQKYCHQCGYLTSACFPENLTHKTQYGPRAKSLMVYINQYQFIPYDRVREFFKTIYGQSVSPGTVVNAVGSLSVRLIKVNADIETLLSQSSVANTDETGININGNKQWLHTVGHKTLTHYAIHKNRGSKATEAIGILPRFQGTLVHDHWKSYFKYKDCRHALCNAHHLRELRFLYEHQHIKWANAMSELLLKINEHKNRLIKKSIDHFSRYNLKKYQNEYDDILSKAQKEQARRGTIESSNLLKRLTGYKGSVLLFMTDFKVPFTNNLSEQDIRMVKIKQKISGCFRTLSGGDNFCRIRSVISTGNKNGKNIFDILQTCFQKIISANDLLVTAE